MAKTFELKKQTFSTEVGGKPLTLEVSQLAGQANAAVLGTYGDTVVLATVVMSKEDKPGMSYFPLKVDYEEKFYAAGKIIGSRYVRREGRPSEEAMLNARLIDRTIRPLFDQHMRRDVQVVVTILTIDEQNDPDFIGLVSASAALAISNIPWDGPVAGVRLSKMNGDMLINPTHTQREGSVLDMFIAGTKERINMIETGAQEALEAAAVQLAALGFEEIKKLIAFQEDMIKSVGRPKAEVKRYTPSPELVAAARELIAGKLEPAVFAGNKAEMEARLGELKVSLAAQLTEKGFAAENLSTLGDFLDEEINELVHDEAIKSGRRPDGRALDEIRPLSANAGLLKRTHGSALFMRGNTQVLSITTLAAPGQEQLVETMEITTKRRFLHHYNFPPYSVGETGFFRGPGRREIGHGALAEKALKPMLPETKDFPYTIRVVSETLSSNGSSSMASTCAASLSLMDAGVPVKKPVAGIAMGLMSKGSEYRILTDIQGPEDHHGDMDLKVAGTADGITAIQMDVKIDGLTVPMFEEALAQAKKARLEILEVMRGALSGPRPELSPYAPRVFMLMINPEKIREVIGTGGKVINEIIDKTGTTIDIEQDGSVFVTGVNAEGAERAIAWIKEIVREFQIGEIVEGKIVKVMDFGAILQITPQKDGMIHISEIAKRRINRVEDVYREGDTVKARIVKLDRETGRIGLSTKEFN